MMKKKRKSTRREPDHRDVAWSLNVVQTWCWEDSGRNKIERDDEDIVEKVFVCSPVCASLLLFHVRRLVHSVFLSVSPSALWLTSSAQPHPPLPQQQQKQRQRSGTMTVLRGSDLHTNRDIVPMVMVRRIRWVEGETT